MACNPLTILDTIRSLLLADTAFNALNVIYRGVPNKVPISLYPFGMVVITNDGEARPMSGGPTITAYNGVIGFSISGRDVPSPAARIANVDSYDTVVGLVQATKTLFNPNDNPNNFTLGGLAGDDWAVIGFYIADGGEVEYGYAEPEDRENNYENYAVVPFVCAVNE